MSRSRDQLLSLWARAAEALAAVDPALHAELHAARADLAARLPLPPAPIARPAPVVLTEVQRAAIDLAGKSGYLHLEVQGKAYSVNIGSDGEPYSITVVYGPARARVHRLLAGGGNLEAQNPSPTVRRVIAAVRQKAQESLSTKD